MKAKELMVGDYVNYRGQIIKVTSLYDKGGSNEVGWGIKEDTWVNADNVESIPLTPEILERNGWIHEFDKTDYMVKYDLGKEGKNCWMMWAIKEHNLDIQRQDENLDIYNLKVSRVVIPCDYVHQLQHALRLCGIEKEIVI